jgi:hypothetical protein
VQHQAPRRSTAQPPASVLRVSRDAERIEEEIAGAVRGLRPRSLASDYLRQAADALDAAGDPSHLYRKWRGSMPPRPLGFGMMRRWARAERFECARTSVLFCALAAEAYVNEFLAAFALSKTRLKELDGVSTVRKYTHGTREAYGATLFRDGDEATPVLRRLFALRHLLVHPKPGFGQPALLDPEDPALEERFALPELAEYVVIVGGCSDLMAWRAYGYGMPDVPGTMLWHARDAVRQFAAERRALPEPDAEPRQSLWELVHAQFDALRPLPDHPDTSWTRIREARMTRDAKGPAAGRGSQS